VRLHEIIIASFLSTKSGLAVSKIRILVVTGVESIVIPIEIIVGTPFLQIWEENFPESNLLPGEDQQHSKA